MKIQTKLVGGFILIALIGALLGVAGLFSNNSLTDDAEEIIIEGIDTLIREVARFKVS